MKLRIKRRIEFLVAQLKTRKVIIEVIGGLVAVTVGIVALVEVFHPIKLSPEAKLEIVDFAIDQKETGPTLLIKLRNRGGTVAFMTRAELLFDRISITEERGDAAATVHPAPYNWLISLPDLKNQTSRLRVSRKVDVNDTDYLQFVIGFEQLKSQFEGTFRLRLYYNEDQVVETKQSKIIVSNWSGSSPQFVFAENSADLLTQLQETDAPYTIRQIIQELTRREHATSSSVIQQYIHHSDSDVRWAAAMFFTKVKSSAVIPELFRLISDDAPQVREFASKALVFQGEASIEIVEKLMSNNDPAIRELAVVIIAQIKSPRSEALILKAVKDRGIAKVAFGEPILVCATAIHELASIQSKKVSTYVIEGLQDENLSVRLAAIDAAKSLQLHNAIPLLKGMANHSDDRVRAKVTEALIQLGAEASFTQ